MPSGDADRSFMPFSLPWLNEKEIDAVVRCLEGGWLTTGPATAEFEKHLQAYLSAPSVVAVNSCTAALHIAYTASGIGPDDEIIMSPMTFCATANAAVHLGATPRFVDIEEDTENIDCERIPAAINAKTKIIVPVDFAGHPCRLDRIAEIARGNDLKIVEDAAHAIGSEYKEKKIGSFGWPTCFSFYPIKNMTTGEGGAIACADDLEFVARCRRLSLHGISKSGWSRYTEKGTWYYEVLEPGYKYNMTDIQAAIGIQQLKKLDEFIARRNHLASLYDQAFQDIPEIRCPVTRGNIHHARHLYVIQLVDLPRPLNRDRVIEQLREFHIGTTVNFIPLHLQPYYRDRYGFQPQDFPVATRVYQRSISLPLYPKMKDEDVLYVAEQLINIVKS
ncbi:MAG: DegT/DnrJ/EryC1/StrS family aminotransferase [bacterium]